jgi:hypothetical protein
MTELAKSNVINMKRWNEQNAEFHEQLIFYAISHLGTPKPIDIQRHIESQFRSAISIRTIHRRLKSLEDQGVVAHSVKKQSYNLTEAASSDLRFSPKANAKMFGQYILHELLSMHFPTLFGMEKNLSFLIEILGLYLVYCMIEACRPLADSTNGNKEYLIKLFKDRSVLRWIKDVIDPELILECFISAISNQLKQEDISENRRKHLKANGENKNDLSYVNTPDESFQGAPSTKFFFWERIKYICSEDGHLSYRNNDLSLYELNKEIIDEMTKILKRKYGNYYEQISKVKKSFRESAKSEYFTLLAKDLIDPRIETIY